MADRVQEILILADSLPGRSLPLTCLNSIEVFSNSDKQLVRTLLDRSRNDKVEVVLSNAEKRVSDYTAGQSCNPGLKYLKSHQELFAAVQSENEVLKQELMERLSGDCFD